MCDRISSRRVALGCNFATFMLIKGYEIMHMIRKGQIPGVEKTAVQQQVKFIAEIFGVAS